MINLISMISPTIHIKNIVKTGTSFKLILIHLMLYKLSKIINKGLYRYIHLG